MLGNLYGLLTSCCGLRLGVAAGFLHLLQIQFLILHFGGPSFPAVPPVCNRHIVHCTLFRFATILFLLFLALGRWWGNSFWLDSGLGLRVFGWRLGVLAWGSIYGDGWLAFCDAAGDVWLTFCVAAV